MNTKKEKLHSFTNILKFISGIISWTILVILVIVAGFLLYYFVSVRLYAQKGEAYKPAFSLYTILSPSMEPNINVYDVIFDVNVDSPEKIKEGDVITFTSTATLTRGMTITHRVVQVIQDENGYSYMTKGDNNLANDGAAVPYENVLGKVLFRIPKLGRVQEFLGTRGGWLIVVVIPALIIIISDILKIFRLKTAKNQVENYEQKELVKKKEEQERKEKIKEKLLEKYEDKKSLQDESDAVTPEERKEENISTKNDNAFDEFMIFKNDNEEQPKDLIEKEEITAEKENKYQDVKEEIEEQKRDLPRRKEEDEEKEKKIREEVGISSIELPKLKTEEKKPKPTSNNKKTTSNQNHKKHKSNNYKKKTKR